MPLSVSPPISPKTIRHPKRSRQSSKCELSVEELNQDDIGYDGDVEVIRPEQYEEPSSESDDDKPAPHLIPDVDEEITRGMRQLGWRQSSSKLQTNGLGGPQGHNSDGLQSSPLNQHGKRGEVDVADFGDVQSRAPPAKRRKKRGSQSSIAHRLMRGKPHQQQTDSSDKTEGQRTPLVDTSTGSTGFSEGPPEACNDEMVLD
ncbi:uncharacterized protein HMPREF1541_03345 [Cyphellophora europaea CBS 101466]|uniref:Uncharacterized protein n=1 Tax=Cyphellophora europaea (strain CBS 101466) TaxID=1220924 RepID=W2RYL5_CYPE1|nr:uncharacterized protein HMPREF1541_03345 [Cyphellophora europaea CBS 101466]ETN41410.1 hypothetical protein HMPREF1541_03345 [Cyphellophora europaea CBS 101466]